MTSSSYLATHLRHYLPLTCYRFMQRKIPVPQPSSSTSSQTLPPSPRSPRVNPTLFAIVNIENDNNLYVCYQNETNRLLFVKSAVEVHESIDIRTSLLWRYPQINFKASLQDAHIYLFKHWIINLITNNKKISSIKTDLIPLLAKMQWQSILLKTLNVPNRTNPSERRPAG